MPGRDESGVPSFLAARRRKDWTQMIKFTDLSLDPAVLQAVQDAGYETPTPIQAQAIPPALEGRDVLGIAQTGTGKTGAFTLPLITRLIRGRARARMPRSLVLAPTRELAAQVAENFDTYAKHTRLTKALLIGGVAFGEQDRLIDRGVDVLIATPGRLLDHFERGKLLLTGVEVLVVDEADRMLDMGFIPDIERIFRLTPFTRQTLFFSATMPPEIERLTSQFLANAVKVEVARQATTSATIEQALIQFTPSKKDRAFAEKRALLRALIRAEGEACSNAIIFCNRKIDVDVVAKSLKAHGFDAAPIHGDLEQAVRMRTLDGFRDGTLRFLVASDVAARGLDIPQVSHVFNFDVPTHPEDYVHRIGRTGRAGRRGKAFTLALDSDQKYIDAIEQMIRAPLPRASMPEGFRPGAGADSRPAGEGERGRGERGRDRDAGRPRDGRGGRRERPIVPHDREAPMVPLAPAHTAAAAAPAAEPAAAAPPAPASRPAAVAAVPFAEAIPAPRPPARADRRSDRRERGPRRERADDAQVIGLGDHVPDFLMRSFRAG
jgi:superfamily II DNA/RNA helicase